MKWVKRFFKFLTLIIVLALFSSWKKDSPFILVLLPDIQYYTALYPEILNSQINWITKNSRKISFVLQQGDLTDNNSEQQWKIVAETLSQMDKKVPFTFLPGNHDMGEKGLSEVRNTKLFNKYFPYTKYSNVPTFKGAFTFGEMDNTWHTFKAGGINWLILSLEFAPRTTVLNWASKIVEEHPRHKIIINTHAYLYSDNTRMANTSKYKGTAQNYGIGKDKNKEAFNNGDQIWEKLIKIHPNIMFVFCGHVLNDGTGLLVSEGIFGNKVYQMLANYQTGVDGSKNGGNGFLRLITINPKSMSISVKTYSPYLDVYKTDSDNQFTFENVNFNEIKH